MRSKAAEAMEYAFEKLEHRSILQFLELWYRGEFDELRKEFPDTPKELLVENLVDRSFYYGQRVILTNDEAIAVFRHYSLGRDNAFVETFDGVVFSVATDDIKPLPGGQL